MWITIDRTNDETLKATLPTEADADEHGEVLWMTPHLGSVACTWDDGGWHRAPVAWMPIPPLVQWPFPFNRSPSTLYTVVTRQGALTTQSSPTLESARTMVKLQDRFFPQGAPHVVVEYRPYRIMEKPE